MIKQYVQGLTPKRVCKNFIVYSTPGGTWSGRRCDNNQPVSGMIPAGGSIQTGCIVEDSLVLNSANIGTQSDCVVFPTGNAVSSGYTATATPGGACSMAVTVYVPPPATNIVTGVQVYEDLYMTLPLYGMNYIKSSAGEIFEIDSNTGIVGNSTNTTC